MSWRVHRHRLDERAPKGRLLDVVSELCGLHAQVMSSAELATWARLDDVSPADVRNALWKERSLVKIWAMRGTLHLLPTSEYTLWQAALGTYDHYLKPSWSKHFGVSPAQLDTIIEAVGRALDGRMLTREALASGVARLTRSEQLGETLRESWGAVLKTCSFRGVLCFAPSDGQKVRFTSPSTWLGIIERSHDQVEALRDVIRRFLATYGRQAGTRSPAGGRGCRPRWRRKRSGHSVMRSRRSISRGRRHGLWPNRSTGSLRHGQRGRSGSFPRSTST